MPTELAVRLAEATGHPRAAELRHQFELEQRQQAMEASQLIRGNLATQRAATGRDVAPAIKMAEAEALAPSGVLAPDAGTAQQETGVLDAFGRSFTDPGLSMVKPFMDREAVERAQQESAIASEATPLAAKIAGGGAGMMLQLAPALAAAPLVAGARTAAGAAAGLTPAATAARVAAPSLLRMGAQAPLALPAATVAADRVAGADTDGVYEGTADLLAKQVQAAALGGGSFGAMMLGGQAGGKIMAPLAAKMAPKGADFARSAAAEVAQAPAQLAAMKAIQVPVEAIAAPEEGAVEALFDPATLGEELAMFAGGQLLGPAQIRGAQNRTLRQRMEARRADPSRASVIDARTAERVAAGAAGRLPQPGEAPAARVADIADTLERGDLANAEYGELTPEMVMRERARVASLEGQRAADAQRLADVEAQRANEARNAEARRALAPDVREQQGIAAERERMAREQRALDIDKTVQRELEAALAAEDVAREEGDAVTEASARELEARLGAEARARAERSSRNDIAKIELEEMRARLGDMEQSLAARGPVSEYAKTVRERVENEILGVRGREDGGLMAIDADGVLRPVDRSVLRANRREITERVRREVEAFKAQTAREREQIAQVKQAIRERHAAIKAEDAALKAEARERKRVEAEIRRAVPAEPAAARAGDIAPVAEMPAKLTLPQRVQQIMEAKRAGTLTAEEAKAALARAREVDAAEKAGPSEPAKPAAAPAPIPAPKAATPPTAPPAAPKPAGEAEAKAAYDTLRAQTEAAKAKAAAKTATADEMREGVSTAKARVAEARKREQLAVTRYDAMAGDELAAEAVPEAMLAKEQAVSERRRAEADLAELEAASAAAKRSATEADITAKREAHRAEATRLKAATEAAIKRDFTPEFGKDTTVEITDTGVVVRNAKLGVEVPIDLMDQKDLDALMASMPGRLAESLIANNPDWQAVWRAEMGGKPPADGVALSKHPDLAQFVRKGGFVPVAFRQESYIKVSRQDAIADVIREELNHESIRSMERNAPEKFATLTKASEAMGYGSDVEGVWQMFKNWIDGGAIDAMSVRKMKDRLDAVEQAQVTGVFKWLRAVCNAVVKLFRRKPGATNEPSYVPIFTEVARGEHLGKRTVDEGDFATRRRSDEEESVSPPPSLRERMDDTRVGRAITRTTDTIIGKGKDIVEGAIGAAREVGKRVTRSRVLQPSEAAEIARVQARAERLKREDPEAYAKLDEPSKIDFATRRRRGDEEESDNEEDMGGEEIDPADSRGVKLANPYQQGGARDFFRGIINAVHASPERKTVEDLISEAQRILESETGESRLRAKFRNGTTMASEAETLAYRALMNADSTRVFSKVPTIAEMQEIARMISEWQHMGTKQARALAVRRDPMNTPEERVAEIGRWFVNPTKELSDRMEAARISGNTRELNRLTSIQAKIAQKTLYQFQRTFGGELTDFAVVKDRMQYARLHAIIERMRAEAAREVGKTEKIDQKFMDKLYGFGSWANSVNAEWVRSALLSGPTTFIKNAASNAGNFFYKTHLQQPLMEAIAGHNPLRPVAEFYKAALPGIAEGWMNAINAFKYERDLFEMAIFNEPGTYASGREDYRAPQGGKVRKLIRTPLRAMGAADAFFKAFYARTNVALQAYRLAHEGGAKPTPEKIKAFVDAQMRDLGSESWQRAYADAATVTFQELTARYADANDTGSIKALADAIIKVRDASGPIGMLVVPFVMTPMAIIRQAMLRSPVGFGRMGYRAVQNHRFKSSGGKEGRQYSAIQMRRDAVDAILGSAIMALVAGLAYDENGDKVITGSPANWMAERGKRDAELSGSAPQPMSIRVNGNYVNYSSLEPFSTLLQMGADAAEMSRKGQSSTKLISKGVDMFASKSSLTSFGDVYRAVTGENDTGLASYVAGRLTSYQPRAITQPIMLARDEVMPARPKNPDKPLAAGEEEGFGSKVGRVVRDRTPGITRAFPRIDLGGDEVPAYSTADTSLGVALATAGFRISVPDDQKWKKLIYTRNERLPDSESEWWPTGWNDSTMTEDGELVMTAKERYDFHRKYGAMLKDAANKIVTDSMLADPTGEQAKRGVERIKSVKDRLSTAMMAEFRRSRRAAAAAP